MQLVTFQRTDAFYHPPNLTHSHNIRARVNCISFESSRISSHYHLAHVHRILSRPSFIAFQSGRISSHYHPAAFRSILTRPNFVTLQSGRVLSHYHPTEFRHILTRPNFVTFHTGFIASYSHTVEFGFICPGSAMRLIRHRLNVVPNRNRSCVCFLSTSLFSLPVLFLALICPRVFFGGTRFTISF